MVQNHKLIVVLGLVIDFMGEAVSPVRKQTISGEVGADADGIMSDIDQASFGRRQMRAAANVNISDADTESPVRKHNMMGKVGAYGDIRFLDDIHFSDVEQESFVRKQMKNASNIDIYTAEAGNPVRNDKTSWKVGTDGYTEESSFVRKQKHVLGNIEIVDKLPPPAGVVVRGAARQAELDAAGNVHMEFPILAGRNSEELEESEFNTTIATPIFTYLGCYKDEGWSRDLPDKLERGPREYCAAQCAAAGYRFFGQQWTQNCFCGDTYGKHGQTTGCNCDGVNIGAFRNCIYELQEPTPVPTIGHTSVSETPVCEAWCHAVPDVWEEKCAWVSNLCSACDPCGNLSLLVHDNVPGLEASTKYECEVREEGKTWRKAFVFQSTSGVAHESSSYNLQNGYFEALDNWSHSWINIEVAENTVIEVRIVKIGGTISNVTLQPPHTSASWREEAGEILIKLHGASQLHVDIDGSMGETNTAYWAHTLMGNQKVPAVHSFSVFANPMLDWNTGRPNPNLPNVRTVEPGTPPPVDFEEDVLYFLPGVHDITTMPPCCTTPLNPDNEQLPGCETNETRGNRPNVLTCTVEQTPPYKVKSHKKYYIPADAWLNGYIWTGAWGQVFGVTNLKIFGYGALSGHKFQRRLKGGYATPAGLAIRGVSSSVVEGLTLVDMMNHHLMYNGASTLEEKNIMRHVKVIGWRVNGDGLHVFGYGHVHDLFLRTQDDSMYMGDGSPISSFERGQVGQIFERIQTWSDANGAAFIMTAPGGRGFNAVLDDADVLYFRRHWPWLCGGVFDLRHGGPMRNITFKNVRIHDKFPSCPLFDIEGKASEIQFSNITMDAFPAFTQLPSWTCQSERMRSKWLLDSCSMPYGIPNMMIGENDTLEDFSFQNVKIGGRDMKDLLQDKEAFKLSNIDNISIDGITLNPVAN